MKYNLNALSSEEFEHLAQALLQKFIGPGTVIFGAGRDAAREATFSGTAPYPSTKNAWDGEWIFQAKFHDTSNGVSNARSLVLSDLETELTKITEVYKTPCDNYLLLTNVPLSGVHQVGTRDRARDLVARKFPGIKNVSVLDGNDLSRHLDNNRDVATAYAHLLTSGDVIMQLLNGLRKGDVESAETVRLFLAESYNRDQYSQLEQAGEVSDDRLHLKQVFIDLNCAPSNSHSIASLAIDSGRKEVLDALVRNSEELVDNEDSDEEEARLSVLSFFLEETFEKVVLLGGPGEGKSTLGQYLAQLHRASLLVKPVEELEFVPIKPRIPIRIILRDYAQLLATDPPSPAPESTTHPLALDQYIANTIAQLSGRPFEVLHLHNLLKGNPTLLILDGLDEVPDQRVRRLTLEQVESYLNRCSTLGANVQVLATSRPNSYNDDFAPSEFLHMRLSRLESGQVEGYVERWIAAKITDTSKANRLREIIAQCIRDPQLRLLMTTPLQVTIMILIILNGGTPPRQKEGLFDEYLETIYKREKSKSKSTLLTEKQLLLDLHALVGYLIHRASTASSGSVSASLSTVDYDNVVRAYVSYKDAFSPANELDDIVNSISHEAGDRLVLLVELADTSWGFELRSIQEFFAASHLSDTASSSTQRADRFRAIAQSQHWRNVALFFAGRIGRVNAGEAANIVEVCKDLDRTEPASFYSAGRWLALELAADRALGTNRGLQHSLIEYGLSIVERGPVSVRRASALLKRLSAEDYRDHVVAIARSQLPAMNPEAARELLELVASTRPRAASLEELVPLAHNSHDPTSASSILQSSGRNLPAVTAATLWREAAIAQPERAIGLAAEWLYSERRWFLDVAKEVDLTPTEGQAVIRATGRRPQRVSHMATLSISKPFQVLIAALSEVNERGFYIAHEGTGGRNRRPRSPFVAHDADVWDRTIEAVKAGAVNSLALLTGDLWEPVATELSWAIHLGVGVVTRSSLEAFLTEPTETQFRALQWIPHTTPYGTPIHILSQFCRNGGSRPERGLALAKYLGESGPSTWNDSMSRLTTELSDAGLPAMRLQSFGLNVVGEEERKLTYSLTEECFGLDATLVWGAIAAAPVLWIIDSYELMQEDVDALARMITNLAGEADREGAALGCGMCLSRLLYIARYQLSSPLRWDGLLDCLADLLEQGGQDQALVNAFGEIASIYFAGDATDEALDRSGRWLRLLGGLSDGPAPGAVPVTADLGQAILRLLHIACSLDVPISTGANRLIVSYMLSRGSMVDAVHRCLDDLGRTELEELLAGLSAGPLLNACPAYILVTSLPKVRLGQDPEIVSRMLTSDAELDTEKAEVIAIVSEWALLKSPEDADFWGDVLVRILRDRGSRGTSLWTRSVEALETLVSASPPPLTYSEAALDLPLKGVGSSWPK